MDQKTRFEIENEPFKNYKDVDIEHMTSETDEPWHTLAKELMGETPEKREHSLKVIKEKAQKDGLIFPFLMDNKLNESNKEALKRRFWLMVLRSGEMDPDEAYKVLKNYLRMLKEHPEYFSASHPPTKLDFTFQQQVNSYFNCLVVLFLDSQHHARQLKSVPNQNK